MMFQPVVLWTDVLLYILLILTATFIVWARRKPPIRVAWRKVIKRKIAIIALMVLMVYLTLGVLDSIHFRRALPTSDPAKVHYSPQLTTVLDVLLKTLLERPEKTYSAPFALHAFSRETLQLPNGDIKRVYPRLLHIQANIKTTREKRHQIIILILKGTLQGTVLSLILIGFLLLIVQRRWRLTSAASLSRILKGRSIVPWYTVYLTLWIILIVICVSMHLGSHYHVFGTNKVGVDVFYLTIKSIRTGLMIGTLSTLIMLPFALLLGLAAGFFGGWVDDLIQYVYTTLSSIPGVLLIAAAILSMQVFISNHPTVFPSLAERADARLLALCIILGITSWTGLCRLLRGETMKLREVDYTQAAIALGTPRWRILVKHMLPNVMHIVLIAVVLDFSMLVLAEAVLSYVGVGVDPTAISWGNMINSARLELAREPMVWWPLLAAFILMFVLVLAANLFADAMRDGFDPRSQPE